MLTAHFKPSFLSFLSFFNVRAPPSRSFIIPPGGYRDDRPVSGGPYIFGRENASPSANYPYVGPSATAHFPISVEQFRKMEMLSSQNGKNQKEKSHNRRNHPLRFNERIYNRQSCTRQRNVCIICDQLNV